MKILLIGAGYVGMALLKELKNQDHDIFVTTTNPEKVPILQEFAKNVILIKSMEDSSVQNTAAFCDAIIVLVAPINNQSYESTYLNTAKLISKALEDRATQPHLIYTSSTSVYSGLQNEWVTEDLKLNPESDNQNVLVETEQLFLKLSKTCILRLGGIFGPGREIERRAKRFSGRELPSDGGSPTNHIHLHDIVSAILFCLKRGVVGVYNLVNNDHPTRKELYNRLCLAESLPLPIWNPNQREERSGYKVSNRKIIDAGFEAFHSIW